MDFNKRAVLTFSAREASSVSQNKRHVSMVATDDRGWRKELMRIEEERTR